MKSPETIYTLAQEKEVPHLSLTPEQKNVVERITLGIEEEDEMVRRMANGDVVKTLENGHPLNRLITTTDGKTTGYIACEDFVSHEAYIKYFGTSGETGRNLLKEIPVFLAYAKERGYARLNFHGWNERLNKILTRYGFERVRTDNMADFAVDFYEKSLVGRKTSEEINEERTRAFEQKYTKKVEQDYERTLAVLPKEMKEEKERAIERTYEELSRRLSIHTAEDFQFDDRQKAVLKLKLARHFQQNNSLDQDSLFDAITETPKFINTDKGSLHRLLEVHQEKTLIKIAEIRKKRAEVKGGEAFNPYENLFTTQSGNYYIARLLNMPHLEEESEYMDNCVGTSDSYVNRIKRGEIEILSFRNVPKVNPKTGKLEGDVPIITIEYDLKTKEIRQMKKYKDKYLLPNDPYFADIVDALKQLRTTKTDTDELRNFTKINPSELRDINVRDYHLLTEAGEVSFRDFNPDSGIFVLKYGEMEITQKTPKIDAAKIMRIMEDIRIAPDGIAYELDEVTKTTKAYLGPWNPTVFQTIKQYPNIIHLYESFPDKKIFIYTLETDPAITSPETAEKVLTDKGMGVTNYGKDLLSQTEWSKSKETYELVQFTVAQLGFPNGATTEEILDEENLKKLGLSLCPAEVGPHLRAQYKGSDLKFIAMKPITDRGGSPGVFYLSGSDDGLWLNGFTWAKPAYRWHPDSQFVFVSRK